MVNPGGQGPNCLPAPEVGLDGVTPGPPGGRLGLEGLPLRPGAPGFPHSHPHLQGPTAPTQSGTTSGGKRQAQAPVPFRRV